jgi:superfamily I DNA and RNA helicase
MEEKKKYFNVIVSDNVRSFIAELNEKELTRDDIISIFVHPSSKNYYAITYV